MSFKTALVFYCGNRFAPIYLIGGDVLGLLHPNLLRIHKLPNTVGA
ncbi:hypothetical protein HNQ57_001333 [Zhongshania antarctica]|uniref:Uncharacterized protein n=1 Tax=Zhongshania antarctica TaxID=641702 RepID=A0A840R3Q5_9GAMM|nr:hypothetical protein [Zhongshania antarctica]